LSPYVLLILRAFGAADFSGAAPFFATFDGFFTLSG